MEPRFVSRGRPPRCTPAAAMDESGLARVLRRARTAERRGRRAASQWRRSRGRRLRGRRLNECGGVASDLMTRRRPPRRVGGVEVRAPAVRRRCGKRLHTRGLDPSSAGSHARTAAWYSSLRRGPARRRCRAWRPSVPRGTAAAALRRAPSQRERSRTSPSSGEALSPSTGESIERRAPISASVSTKRGRAAARTRREGLPAPEPTSTMLGGLKGLVQRDARRQARLVVAR